MAKRQAADGPDDGFEQRANVRWDNDFGPATPMWLRYVMAAGAAVFVLGFLSLAVVFGQSGNARVLPAWQWALFALLLVAIVVIALRAEHWALWLQAKLFKGTAPDDDTPT